MIECAFGWFVLVGFLAQLVDGALGMAYGVTSNAFLLALGLPPAAASASVHAAKVATSGTSGLAHWTLGNVDRRLLLRLAVPGALGAVLGALLVSHLPVAVIKPIIAIYLGVMGVRLVRRALGGGAGRPLAGGGIGWTGFLGGLCDASGGGGWGPIVTTTLVSGDIEPRRAIGSGNLAEFFVAVSCSLVFGATIGVQHWRPVAGLILGGVVAAPVAAWTAGRIPARGLMALVGLLIVSLSLRTLWGVVAG